MDEENIENKTFGEIAKEKEQHKVDVFYKELAKTFVSKLKPLDMDVGRFATLCQYAFDVKRFETEVRDMSE